MDRRWMSGLDAYVNQPDEVEVAAVGISYMLRGKESGLSERSECSGSRRGPEVANGLRALGISR
jgi:hypothetical protein